MPELNVTVDGRPVAANASTIRDVIKDKRAIAARVDGALLDLATVEAAQLPRQGLPALPPHGGGSALVSACHDPQP